MRHRSTVQALYIILLCRGDQEPSVPKTIFANEGNSGKHKTSGTCRRSRAFFWIFLLAYIFLTTRRDDFSPEAGVVVEAGVASPEIRSSRTGCMGLGFRV